MEKTKPFLRLENQKHARIELRVTHEEKHQIEARAYDCCMTVSEYTLRRALGRQTRTKHDVHTINELRMVGDTLRDLYAAGQIARPEEAQPVLDAIVRAIDRVASGGLK